jgi:N-terminal domain on NACHT_NTPase and P-loop NTPases
MSGAEAIAVLGVISSIISIVDGTKQVYDAATSAEGLPEAFREVATRLPIISDILGKTERYIKEARVSADAYEGVKQVIQACQDKATKLEVLFRKVIPGENASRRERYIAAVKTLGKGNVVEKLMKGVLQDLQLLVGERSTGIATKEEIEQLARAIKDVSAIPPSIPESELQEHNFTANYSGSGTQYNAQGEYIAQGNARQYNSGGAPMHFGKD